MSVSSTISPKVVELIKIDNNIASYYLRKNITSSSVTDDLTGQTETIYTYDEVIVSVTYVDNQIDIITNNFDAYYALGITQKSDRKDLEEKKKQMQTLIDGGIYQQLNLNYQSIQQLQSVNDVINGFMDWYFTKHPDEI